MPKETEKKTRKSKIDEIQDNITDAMAKLDKLEKTLRKTPGQAIVTRLKAENQEIERAGWPPFIPPLSEKEANQRITSLESFGETNHKKLMELHKNLNELELTVRKSIALKPAPEKKRSWNNPDDVARFMKTASRSLLLFFIGFTISVAIMSYFLRK